MNVRQFAGSRLVGQNFNIRATFAIFLLVPGFVTIVTNVSRFIVNGDIIDLGLQVGHFAILTDSLYCSLQKN